MSFGDPRGPAEGVSPTTRGCLSLVLVVLSVFLLVAALVLWSREGPLILRLTFFVLGALALCLALLGLLQSGRDD